MKILRLNDTQNEKLLTITTYERKSAVIEIDFYGNGTKETFLLSREDHQKLRDFFKE